MRLGELCGKCRGGSPSAATGEDARAPGAAESGAARRVQLRWLRSPARGEKQGQAFLLPQQRQRLRRGLHVSGRVGQETRSVATAPVPQWWTGDNRRWSAPTAAAIPPSSEPAGGPRKGRRNRDTRARCRPRSRSPDARTRGLPEQRPSGRDPESCSGRSAPRRDRRGASSGSAPLWLPSKTASDHIALRRTFESELSSIFRMAGRASATAHLGQRFSREAALLGILKKVLTGRDAFPTPQLPQRVSGSRFEPQASGAVRPIQGGRL